MVIEQAAAVAERPESLRAGKGPNNSFHQARPAIMSRPAIEQPIGQWKRALDWALGSSGSAAHVRGLLQVHACTRGDIVGRQLSASWRRASKGSRVAAPLTRVSSPAIEQPIGQWKRARFGAGIERQRCRRERLAASASHRLPSQHDLPCSRHSVSLVAQSRSHSRTDGGA